MHEKEFVSDQAGNLSKPPQNDLDKKESRGALGMYNIKGNTPGISPYVSRGVLRSNESIYQEEEPLTPDFWAASDSLEVWMLPKNGGSSVT